MRFLVYFDVRRFHFPLYLTVPDASPVQSSPSHVLSRQFKSLYSVAHRSPRLRSKTRLDFRICKSISAAFLG